MFLVDSKQNFKQNFKHWPLMFLSIKTVESCPLVEFFTKEV
jgi:hypothetical protein